MNGMEVRAALARNIKTFRARRNWSQADLAEKSELSVVYLSDIERGNKWPYLNTLVKLAGAFGVEVYELLMPENILNPTTSASILDKFTREAISIFEESLEAARKRTSESLASVPDRQSDDRIPPL